MDGKMMRGLAVAVALAGSLVVPATGADCTPFLARLSQAQKTGDIIKLEAAVDAIDTANGIDCDPSDVRSAKRMLAEALMRRAVDPKLAADATATIEKAAALHADWHAALALGDLQVRRRAYVEAANSYGEAIDLLDGEPAAVIAKVPAEQKAYLGRRLAEMRNLAASATNTLVSAPSSRDGTPGGVFSTVLGNRNLEAAQELAPIQFETDSDKITKVGEDAAKELVTALTLNPRKGLTVFGHTDHRGTAAHNLDLSRRRAEQVVAYLQKEGISARFVVVGKGFSEPRKLSATDYSQAEIDSLNRRVELAATP